MRLSFDSTTQKQDTPVTVGQHTIVIENSAIRGAKSNPANQFLELELKIVEGPDKGRVIYDNLHLSNTNSRAVEIGKSRLSSICHAVGVHPRTIDRYRKTGVLNSVILPGHTRAIGYRLSDVEALLATKNTISVKENSHA